MFPKDVAQWWNSVSMRERERHHSIFKSPCPLCYPERSSLLHSLLITKRMGFEKEALFSNRQTWDVRSPRPHLSLQDRLRDVWGHRNKIIKDTEKQLEVKWVALHVASQASWLCVLHIEKWWLYCSLTMRFEVCWFFFSLETGSCFIDKSCLKFVVVLLPLLPPQVLRL